MAVCSREQRCGNRKRVPSGDIKLHLSIPTRNRGFSGEGVAMPCTRWQPVAEPELKLQVCLRNQLGSLSARHNRNEEHPEHLEFSNQ